MKGMRQDDSDLLFNGAKDAISFAFENYNMRFLADESGTLLAATQEKGNERVDVLFYNEFFLDPSAFEGSFYRMDLLPFRVVGQTVVDKYLVLFGKCEKTTTYTNHDGMTYTFENGDDVVLRVEKGSDGNLYAWLLYDGTELDFRPEMPLETLPHVETDIVKKVYFVDGVHGPRAVNVVNPEGGNLANINMGYSLTLDDELTVTRERSVTGNYPMGKVRFFYTYFNDTYSETAIVDWSPYFDCSMENNGGAPDSLYKTPYAFRIKVANADRQFKYIRIYMQHFTSPDPQVYTLKYIERPLNSDLVDIVFKYDEQDAVATDRTYLDIKATNMNFIPYTLAEKDNRMFYGNIKRSIPDLGDVDFNGTAQVEFYDKYIGDEQLDISVTYKYKPERTTFEDTRSNYGYMGFRKGNWYRFGIIAQHTSGEWSDVMFIKDAKCSKTSRTEVEYATMADRPIKPLRSKFYIPSARLMPSPEFYENMQRLYDLGYRRVKPVCVVPPPQFRTVLTQGISCPTLYKGGDRAVLTNNGRFAIPSWFFRPQPVFDIDGTINGGTVYKADYPYTIRKVSDLKLDGNIKYNNEWIVNPEFTDERYMNFNVLFREWRHGYSLPPKDRANAELQSSDFSVNDYFYYDSSLTAPSPLFGSNGVNLFGFKNGDMSQMYFFGNAPSTSDNWYEQIADRYGVLPWHDLHTTGYDNTMFIDESICTLNSPEIDYDFSAQVEPWFSGKNIEIAGYAQVTGSMANVSVRDSRLKLDEAGYMIDTDSVFDKVTGKCLFDVANSDDVDAEARDGIKNILSTSPSHKTPFVPLAGPWWLDTMLVESFGLPSITHNHGNDIIFPDGNITDGDNETWSPGDPALYSTETKIDNNNARFLYRAFDSVIQSKERKCSWTTSFYGETNKQWHKDKYDVSVEGDAMYPYNGMEGVGLTFRRAIVFSDHHSNTQYNLSLLLSDYESIASRLLELSDIPLTWNMRKLSKTIETDMYWADFEKNRYYLSRSFPFSDSGVITIADNLYSEYVNSILDPCAALYYGDYRFSFSYYFNPIFRNMPNIGSVDNYYKLQSNEDYESDYIRIAHPFLLPHGASLRGDIDVQGNIAKGSRRTWISEASQDLINIDEFGNYRDCAYIDESSYYFRGSEFGCHYYAPGSTNFAGSYFDPYYAHVIYPFMTSSDTPFCGSNDAYRGTENCRPEYNSSNSCLYSSCTNYISKTPDKTTYSAYYHSPNLTHELRQEPDLSDIPFIDSDNTYITKLYSFDCSDSASTPNVPVINHRTFTLTAAMKWYRGFKRLMSTSKMSDGTIKLVSTGLNLDNASITGNMLFSGYEPQFLTHTGLLSNNEEAYGESNRNYNFIMRNISDPIYSSNYVMSDGTNVSEALLNMTRNDSFQLLELSYKSTPHIVYYNQPLSGSLGLMPQLFGTDERFDILETNNSFLPQYYYKEFIAETWDKPTIVPNYVANALGWMKSAYPHTGHFEQFHFSSLYKDASGQPYWNYGNNQQLPLYPSQIERDKVNLDFNSSRFITKYPDGSNVKNNEYWVLPVSNMYNTEYLSNNPYTLADISPESWSWKMCGYTVKISDILANSKRIAYLEGDTYFQRYNCFKTVSKDTMYEYLWQPTDDGQTTAAPGINDVTETASIMIESYINLDGLYWNHSNTVDRETSPLVHPFWNNGKQINPVYGIQNGLCDEFRQIDESYYNSSLTHYPTMLVWSVQKHDGENEDSFGIVPATNRMLVSGECGDVNMLLNYGNKVFCLQEHGLSVLNWNPQVIQPTTTDSTMSIYLSDSTRLQDVVYVSRTTGTKNKWSVAAGQRGFYWMDETLHNISGFIGEGIADITTANGFKSWANSNITAENCVWNANTFTSPRRAFKASVDIESGDFYWMDGKQCLCFNEQLACFTSFYGYHYTPYKFNWLDKRWSIVNGDGEGNEEHRPPLASTLWHDQCNCTHMLYDKDVDAYVDLLVNPAGQYDKVFNFIEYNAEAYLPGDSIIIPHFNPWNHISVSNMYQQGEDDLSRVNTKERFRLWRTSLPREILNKKATLNRIRSPWCRIKLSHIGYKGHNVDPSTNEYNDKLYYINVNYTFPEQPQKTNIRQ